jgi:hypothetical protein
MWDLFITMFVETSVSANTERGMGFTANSTAWSDKTPAVVAMMANRFEFILKTGFVLN